MLRHLLAPFRSPVGVAVFVFGVAGGAIALGPANACEMGEYEAEDALSDLMAQVDQAARDAFEEAADATGEALTLAARALTDAAEAAIDAGTERVTATVDGDTGVLREQATQVERAATEVELQS